MCQWRGSLAATGQGTSFAPTLEITTSRGYSNFMTLDQSIAVVSSIGTFLAAIGAFFAAFATFRTIRELSGQRREMQRTREEAERQRKASYKPDLIVIGSKEIAADGGSEAAFRKWTSEFKPPTSGASGLVVRLENIGLEAAKKVSVDFYCDYSLLVRHYNEFASAAGLEDRMALEIGDNNKYAQRLIKEGTETWSFYLPATPKAVDYILPISHGATNTMLEVPKPFVYALSSLMWVAAISGPSEYRSIKTRASWVLGLTSLQISISYRDLGEEIHETTFDAYLKLDFLTADTGFRGYMRVDRSLGDEIKVQLMLKNQQRKNTEGQ